MNRRKKKCGNFHLNSVQHPQIAIVQARWVWRSIMLLAIWHRHSIHPINNLCIKFNGINVNDNEIIQQFRCLNLIRSSRNITLASHYNAPHSCSYIDTIFDLDTSSFFFFLFIADDFVWFALKCVNEDNVRVVQLIAALCCLAHLEFNNLVTKLWSFAHIHSHNGRILISLTVFFFFRGNKITLIPIEPTSISNNSDSLTFSRENVVECSFVRRKTLESTFYLK